MTYFIYVSFSSVYLYLTLYSNWSIFNDKGVLMSSTGHLAIGFAAKKYTQDISLPILLIAAYSIDLLYFIFIGLKMETYAFNPWSHSLGMALLWSGLGALIFYLFRHNKKQALIIGLLVFSH